MQGTNTVTGQLLIDKDVAQVISFMQENIPTTKLMGIADKLPEIAKLLWSHYSAEPFTLLELFRGQQLTAIE